MSDWDEDDLSYRSGELDREWQQRREQHFNRGYREGLDQGKEKVLQQGFDTGFLVGCQTGYAWGLLQGAVATLSVPALQPPVAQYEKASLQSLAQKINLPHKQVMLTQCDAVLHEASVTGTAGQFSSIGPPVVSNASPSAKELEALIHSVQSTLQELGYAPKARQDMRATSSSQS